MPNYNTLMSSDKTIPCSVKEFNHIERMLEKDCCGIQCEHYNQKELYLFAEENACVEELTVGTCRAIGKLLKKNKLKFVELQLAFTCSKLCMDSQGGTYARLLPDGEVVWQNKSWPKRAQ